MKFNKFLFGLAAVASLALFTPLNSSAALQSQTDTNSLPPLSTNTFVLAGDVTGNFTSGETPGGNAFIDLTKTTQAFGAVGGFFTNTTGQASNIVFRIAQSVDQLNYTNSAQVITLVVPAASTNWCVQEFPLTTPYPIYGLRTIENANAAGVGGKANTMYLRVWPKAGL